MMKKYIMIRCVIIDDEQGAIDYLVDFIGKVPYLKIVATFTDSVEGIGFLHQERVDLLFLDGKMPKLDGLELIQSLPNPLPHIIFCTGNAEFALPSYQLRVTDCLQKPFSFERFSQALHYVRESLYQGQLTVPIMEDAEEAYRFFPSAGKNSYVKILYQEIEHVESQGNSSLIHTVSEKVVTSFSLKEVEKRLPVADFVRIHRSFIIAYRMIKEVVGHKVRLNDKTEIPIGKEFRKPVYEFIEARR